MPYTDTKSLKWVFFEAQNAPNQLLPGLCPGSRWGAYSASSDSLAGEYGSLLPPQEPQTPLSAIRASLEPPPPPVNGNHFNHWRSQCVVNKELANI